MKPELSTYERENTHEAEDSYCLIEEKYLEPKVDDIMKIIRQTQQPIYSVFLRERPILTDLKITSKTNGRVLDLSEYLYENVDIVRTEEAAYIRWDLLPELSDLPLTDEYKNWLLLLVNSNVSIPGARGIGIYHPKNIFDILVILHEMKHVELGHEKGIDMKKMKGARMVLTQEQDSSNLAMIDFLEICKTLGLPDEVDVKARRVLDAMLYSYIVSLNNYYGEASFSDKDLSLTNREKQMVKKFIFLSHGS